MSYYYNYLMSLIQNFSIVGYLLIALLAFLESFAFVGLIIPGSIAVIIGGFLAAHGSLNITILYIFVFVSGFLGDNFSFYLGKHNNISFQKDNKIFKQQMLIRGKNFFEKYGAKSVFLGRFVGWVRPIIPYIAGMFELDNRVFILWSIFSSLLWAASHIALGYFFGRTWQMVALWSTRFTMFFTVLIVFLVLFYLFKWLVFSKGKEIIALFSSIWMSIKEALAQNKELQEYREQHRAFFSFLRKRFEKDNFFGLPLTLFTLSLIYVLALLGGIIEDLLTSDLIVSVDIRIASLLAVFRNETLTNIFFWITLLGKWQIILIFTVTAVAFLLLWNKREYIIPFLISISGSVTFTYIGKLFFHRSRPAVAVYQESSFSFPSGHATIAVAFYGFLIYFLLKMISNWKYKINIFFAGLLLIISIGFSRLYLGVHYLSDVWAGFLVGALWLIIAISISEYLSFHSKSIFDKFAEINFSRKIKKSLSFTLIILALASYAIFAVDYQAPYRKVNGSKEEITVNKAVNIFDNKELIFTETLLGNKEEPISFVILASNKNKLINAFQNAGWYLADDINIHTLYKAAKAAFLNKQYQNAPITPDFWNSKVHDFGFEKPGSSDNIRVRHHARFWESNFVRKDGMKIYIGTASFDSGLKWGVTHKIDPNIDAEREYLFKDLLSTSLIKLEGKYQLIEPNIGINFAGDPFFTDGKVYVVIIN